MTLELHLPDAEATEALGAKLAAALANGGVVHLRGDLGAGKTTLVRGLLRALGHAGTVKSPTYALVEPYRLGGRAVYHFDLYRLVDAEELEYIGIRDFLEDAALLLIEWPERGEGVLPPPDLRLAFEHRPDGRRCRLSAASARGEAMLATLGGEDEQA